MDISKASTSFRTLLLQRHLPLARSIAFQLKRSYVWVDSDELYSYALWGLTLAAKAYMPKRGVPFSNFAIRKARYLAIDAMREDKVIRRSSSSGGPALPYWPLSVNGSCLENISEKNSGATIRDVDLRDQIQVMLRRLGEEDRRLLQLYYADGMTFKEIGHVLNRCEAAICMRHKTLISRLRKWNKAAPGSSGTSDGLRRQP